MSEKVERTKTPGETKDTLRAVSLFRTDLVRGVLARPRGHFRVSHVSLDGLRKRESARSLGKTQRDLTSIPERWTTK